MLEYSAFAKDVAYRSVVRPLCPCIEYACVMWNPHAKNICALLDMVQNHGAGWIMKSLEPSNFKSSSNSVPGSFTFVNVLYGKSYF